MPILSWRPDYEVGVPEIDDEHRYLFGLINAFYDSHEAGDARELVLRELSTLVAYAENHFQHEEALQLQIGYPDIDAHRQLHAGLIASLFDFAERVRADPNMALADMRRFLRNWLVAHVVRADTAIGDHMRRRGQGESKP